MNIDAIKSLQDLRVFPVVKDLRGSKFYEILRQVYPLKQRCIQALLEYAPTVPQLKKIVLFGSSITMRCRQDSDIDIMVWMNECEDARAANRIYAEICSHLGENPDVLHTDWFPKTESIWDEIDNGVVIYEQAI